MPTLNTTPNRAYQEPFLGNELSVDVGRIISALRAIDTDMAAAFAQIVAKAGLNSPAFTGVPTVPTAAPGTDTGQAASTAFVRAAIAALVDSSPGALDTLNELAAALGDDPNFSTTVLTAIGLKADAAATTAALALKADAATTVTGAGLASGGGDLSANRVVTVTKATDAEHEARVRDDVAATPKGVGLALAAYNKWETIEEVTLTAAASYIRTNLSAFYELVFDGSIVPSSNCIISMGYSTDNGATYVSSADHVQQVAGGASGASSVGTTAVATALGMSWTTLRAPDDFAFILRFVAFNKARRGRLFGTTSLIDAGPSPIVYSIASFTSAAAPGLVARNAIRILPSAGNMSGQFTLAGKRG